MHSNTALAARTAVTIVAAVSLALVIAPGASATEAADPDRATVRHFVVLWTLESESGVNLHCPDSHPYLIKPRLAERAVPFGVQVESDSHFMPVTALAHERDGYQSGVKDMLITNLDVLNIAGNRWAEVTLHCTNDTSEAAPW